MSIETNGEKFERVLNNTREMVIKFFSNFSKTTADTLGWLAIIVLHASTVPGYWQLRLVSQTACPLLNL